MSANSISTGIINTHRADPVICSIKRTLDDHPRWAHTVWSMNKHIFILTWYCSFWVLLILYFLTFLAKEHWRSLDASIRNFWGMCVSLEGGGGCFLPQESRRVAIETDQWPLLSGSFLLLSKIVLEFYYPFYPRWKITSWRFFIWQYMLYHLFPSW